MFKSLPLQSSLSSLPALSLSLRPPLLRPSAAAFSPGTASAALSKPLSASFSSSSSSSSSSPISAQPAATPFSSASSPSPSSASRSSPRPPSSLSSLSPPAENPQDDEEDPQADDDLRDFFSPSSSAALSSLPFTVSIIGRPNVGKSTLFNRLIPSNRASHKSLVDPMPGVTRDAKTVEEGGLGDLSFTLNDTAGFEKIQELSSAPQGAPTARLPNGLISPALQEAILEQTERTVRKSDLLLFLLDGRTPLTQEDEHFLEWLKRKAVRNYPLEEEGQSVALKIPIVLVVNKIEDDISVEDFFADGLDNGMMQKYPGLLDCFQLGLGEPVLLSAERNEGFSSLYERIKLKFQVLKKLKTIEKKALDAQRERNLELFFQRKQKKFEDFQVENLKVALVGLPNSGKSTLFNSIVGEQKALTGPEAGITRDPLLFKLPQYWESEKRADRLYTVSLIDTAGLKGSGIGGEHGRFPLVDSVAMKKSLSMIEQVQIVLMMVDVTTLFPRMMKQWKEESNKNKQQGAAQQSSLEAALIADFPIKRDRRYSQAERSALALQFVSSGSSSSSFFSHHDQQISRRVLDEGRGCLVLVNKWDLVPQEIRADLFLGISKFLEKKLNETKGVTVLPICAKALDVPSLQRAVCSLFERWESSVPSPKLNRWLRSLVQYKPHPNIQGRKVRVKFLAQVASKPPHFLLFANRVPLLSAQYVRFLRNALREEFGLEGVPIRISLRSAKNPFVKDGQEAKRQQRRLKEQRRQQRQQDRAGEFGRLQEEAQFEQELLQERLQEEEEEEEEAQGRDFFFDADGKLRQVEGEVRKGSQELEEEYRREMERARREGEEEEEEEGEEEEEDFEEEEEEDFDEEEEEEEDEDEKHQVLESFDEDGEQEDQQQFPSSRSPSKPVDLNIVTVKPSKAALSSSRRKGSLSWDERKALQQSRQNRKVANVTLKGFQNVAAYRSILEKRKQERRQKKEEKKAGQRKASHERRRAKERQSKQEAEDLLKKWKARKNIN